MKQTVNTCQHYQIIQLSNCEACCHTLSAKLVARLPGLQLLQSIWQMCFEKPYLKILLTAVAAAAERPVGKVGRKATRAANHNLPNLCTILWRIFQAPLPDPVLALDSKG